MEEKVGPGATPPASRSGRWIFEVTQDGRLVTLSEFPLRSGVAGEVLGFQVLRAERARDGVRLYADYDVNAYYLKRK